MARALAAAIIVSLLAVSGAGGAGAQAPKRGGTVVFGPVQEFVCLNPLRAACQGLQVSWIREAVLPPVFTVAPDLSLRPKLVSGVTFTRKPPFTLTYHIRPEARWSDGVPVTAQDFLFTHSMIVTHFSTDPQWHIYLNVQSVRTVDKKTVRVTLRSRDGAWRSLFGVVLPRHVLAGEDIENVWSDRIDNPKTGEPIGSGPFLVERWARGKQLVLRRNPHYWGPHLALVDRLVVRFCQASCASAPVPEVLEGLRSGGVDFALVRDTALVSELRRIPGFRVLATATNGWEHLDMRVGPGGHPALRSKLVRRALAFGIDRVAIARKLFAELDPSYRPRDSAIFSIESRQYRPDWSRYRYRRGQARSLLEQAGCRRGADGIYVCAGRRLELRLVTVAGAGLRQRTIELIQAQLRQIGVEAALAYVPGPALFGQLLPSGDYDLVSFAWFDSSPERLGTKDVFGCGGAQNWTGYCQRLVTRDLDQADRILDADQRALVLNRADRQLASDVPIVPLYDIPFVLAYRTTVQGVVVSPYNLFWNAENWWLER